MLCGGSFDKYFCDIVQKSSIWNTTAGRKQTEEHSQNQWEIAGISGGGKRRASNEKWSFSLQVSWTTHLNFVKWDLMIECKATSLEGCLVSPLSFQGPTYFVCYCSCYSSLQSLLSLAWCLGIFFFVVSLFYLSEMSIIFSSWYIRSWQLLPVEVIYTTPENRLIFAKYIWSQSL